MNADISETKYERGYLGNRGMNVDISETIRKFER